MLFLKKIDFKFLSDPRHFQIVTLSTLLTLQFFWADLPPSYMAFAAIIASVLGTQYLCSHFFNAPFDFRSPLITGLSLTILLKASALWIYPLAAVIAIGSKFLVRVKGRHIFNPANIGIVAVLLLLPDYSWISPGQWGSTIWLAALLACLAFLVLFRVSSRDMAFLFLFFWVGALVLRALWLGDPLAIPMHQLQSGALLIFAFFMITDPKTIPSRFWQRLIFALVVTIVAYILTFEFRIRESLFYALALVCLISPLIQYNWKIPTFLKKRKNTMIRLLLTLFVFMAMASPAQAFCGFFVSKAEADLFNEASKVILARADDRTVITMANDYQGGLDEFAIVIPVPSVITEKQVNVTENRIMDHLDAYTAPRLVEYFDSDPCQQIRYREMMSMADSAAPQTVMGGVRKSAKSLGVTIEAEYTVGEYDIVILSAKQSDGLQSYLNQEGYKMPDGADNVLNSYIKQDMKFFLAKVNLKEQEKSGYSYLRPLQVAYEHKKFMLPIRLGTLNAKGPQDLILFTLTKEGRVETSNYRTTKIPTGDNIPLFVKDEFGAFYKAMFDEAVKKENMKTVFLEYAWDMGWCDPCAADPVPNDDLKTLGVWWLNDQGGPKPVPLNSRRIMPPQPAPANVFVTRMHVRYDAKTFPEDLMLQETSDRQNFQGRYVMNHPWTGEMSCSAGQDYVRQLPERFEKEAQNLSKLTGWDIAMIREKMEKGGQEFEVTVPDPKPWWESIWN